MNILLTLIDSCRLLLFATMKAQFVIIPLFILYLAVSRYRDVAYRWILHKGLVLSLFILPLLFLVPIRIPFIPEGAKLRVEPVENASAVPPQTIPHAGVTETVTRQILSRNTETTALAPSFPVKNSLSSHIFEFPEFLLNLFSLLSAAGLLFFLVRYAVQKKWENKIIKNAGSVYRAGPTRIIYSHNITQSFASGLFRKKIFIPRQIQAARDISGVVLQHEKIHLQKRHLWWALAEALLARMFWYNPFMRLLASRGYLLREMICDRETAGFFGSKMYVETLLKSTEISHPRKQPLVSAAWGNRDSILYKRIEQLLTSNGIRRKKSYPLLLSSLLICVLFSLGALNCSSPVSADKKEVQPTGDCNDEIQVADAKNAVKEENMTEETKVPAAMTFAWPVAHNPGRITAEYGMELHPITNKARFHRGIDIAWRLGTSIVASAGGVIEEVKYNPDSTGRSVLINHGNNIKTFYSHLDRVLCKDRQVIKAGELIAYMGSTGMSTGPHLHFEIRQNGKELDPGGYLTLPEGVEGFTNENIKTDFTRSIPVPYRASR